VATTKYPQYAVPEGEAYHYQIPYGPSKDVGTGFSGFSELRLSPTQYKVAYEGGDGPLTELRLFYRAAEVTAKAGFRYFELTGYNSLPTYPQLVSRVLYHDGMIRTHDDLLGRERLSLPNLTMTINMHTEMPAEGSFIGFDAIGIVKTAARLLDIERRSNVPTLQLFKAIQQGDLEDANEALAHEGNINARFSVNEPLPTPCATATRIPRSIQSPLSMAAFSGNERMLTFLLDKGADIDNPSYCTPLAVAVIAIQPDIVRILISKGASPMLTKHPFWLDKGAPTTVVMLAAWLNRADMIDVLCETKIVDLDHTDLLGRTALFFAAEMGYSDPIRALVKHGASINHQRPDSGQTALALAVVNQKVEAVRTLLALGADPNIPYRIPGLTETRTVTPLAIARQGKGEILSLLEQAGAKDTTQ
jgi:hypothetical protein